MSRNTGNPIKPSAAAADFSPSQPQQQPLSGGTTWTKQVPGSETATEFVLRNTGASSLQVVDGRDMNPDTGRPYKIAELKYADGSTNYMDQRDFNAHMASRWGRAKHLLINSLNYEQEQGWIPRTFSPREQVSSIPQASFADDLNDQIVTGSVVGKQPKDDTKNPLAGNTANNKSTSSQTSPGSTASQPEGKQSFWKSLTSCFR